MAVPNFQSLSEFYPYYLTQHQHATARTLHFIGTGLLFPQLFLAIYLGNYWLLLLLPVVGYGFAWTGHFFFEKNKPAAFKNPLWSLAGDFIMFWDILTGQLPKKMQASLAQAESEGWE
jgi:hypothetical protein